MILASELILKILLSHTYVEDKLFWPYVSNGIYSVKSGYNFLAKEKSSLLLIPNSQVDVRSIRKQLWSLSELLATLVWFIWYRRNLVWTNNKPFPISQVVPLASQTLQDFFSDFIDPKDTRSCYA